MRKGDERASISFGALGFSILVHLVVLSVFGVVKFSESSQWQNHDTAPIVNVSQIRKFIESQPIIPKPKIKQAINSKQQNRATLIPVNLVSEKTTFIAKPENDNKIEATRNRRVVASNAVLSGGIEFFGSFTKHRKVCFVVDCSGSMQGAFRQVRDKLKDSIGKLQPDQYFYIIFFAGEKLTEFGDGWLIRATPKSKADAFEFIDSMRPYGKTNAIEAISRAVRIRDRNRNPAELIYFLTDGFELSGQDAERFMIQVENLQKQFAPATKINTIGFWTQWSDRKMLKKIAGQSGGDFVFVASENY